MKYFIPAIIWAIIIFYLSGNPGVQLPESPLDFLAMDKLAHFITYALLAFLLGYGFSKNLNLTEKQIIFAALILSSLYGLGMEIMQYSFFPNRYFEVLDIIANISGSLIGTLFFKHIFLKTR